LPELGGPSQGADKIGETSIDYDRIDKPYWLKNAIFIVVLRNVYIICLEKKLSNNLDPVSGNLGQASRRSLKEYLTIHGRYYDQEDKQ
jgi:hypothetical protein